MPPPPEDDLRRLPPAEADALIASLGSFLTVAIHSLLFHRRLYPPTSFLLARAYNLAVYQSRHPGVCAWVRDAVAAVAAQIRAGALRSLALVVHRPGDFAVAERWTFDLSSFPLDPLSATHPPPQPAPADALDPDAAAAVNSTDLAEALRAALSRIAHTAETIGPPPEGSIFTLAVELRPEAPAPIQHPQLWIPAEPHLQPPASASVSDPGPQSSSTIPIRSVRAGPLFFECWFEQASPQPLSGSPKAASHETSGATRQASQSPPPPPLLSSTFSLSSS